MNRLNLLASNAYRISARLNQSGSVCRLRNVAGGVAATASLSLCVLGVHSPVKQESSVERTKHGIERKKDEVEECVQVVAKQSEPIMHKVEEKLADMVHEIENEFTEFIVHPLRDTEARYVPYVLRFSKVFSRYKQYLAYSSDVGEAFRPIASARVVNATYGVAVAYCAGDVLHNGYLQYQIDPNDMGTVALTMVHSAVFQALASLLAPYLVIHTAVHKSNHHYFKTATCNSPVLKTWGSSIVALSIIPFLPLVDEPIEEAVDWVFDHVVPHKASNREHETKQKAAGTENNISFAVPTGMISPGVKHANE